MTKRITSLTLERELVERIDRNKGKMTRSVYVSNVLEEHFSVLQEMMEVVAK